MEYKVGDRVLLYTFKEITNNGNIHFSPWNFWYNAYDKYIHPNRIETILESNDYFFNITSTINNGVIFIYKNMVKCHANEHYLQEIKDEL